MSPTPSACLFLPEEQSLLLGRACRADDGERVAQLLALGFDPNSPMGESASPSFQDLPLLTAYAHAISAETMRVFLRGGADPNPPGPSHLSPLMGLICAPLANVWDPCADESQRLAKLELLISFGAKAGARPPASAPPYPGAGESFLLSAIARLPDSATSAGAIRALLAAGASIEETDSSRPPCRPLWVAVKFGRQHATQALLAAGASPLPIGEAEELIFTHLRESQEPAGRIALAAHERELLSQHAARAPSAPRAKPAGL